MKVSKLLIPFILISVQSFSQNSPFFIWGPGLDGSTYQKTGIYSDTNYGLLFEAPKDASGSKLDISFNWRGGGVTPLFIQGSAGNVGIQSTNPQGTLQIADYRPVIIKSNGGSGVYGSKIGFNAVLNTSVVPNTFRKLGGTSQNGGASIAVDYSGNMLFQNV